MGKKQNENQRQTRSQKAGKPKRTTAQIQPFILMKTKVWQKDSHGLFDYEAEEDQYVFEKQKLFPFKKKIHKHDKATKQIEKESRILIYRSRDCQTQAIIVNPQSNHQSSNDLLGVCEILATRLKRGVNFKIRTALKLENLSTALERQAKKLQNKQGYQQLKQLGIDKLAFTLKPNIKQPQIKVFNPLLCPFTVAKKFYKGTSNNQGYALRPGNIIKFGRVQYVVVELKTDKQFVSLRNTTDLKDVSGYQGIYEADVKQDDKQLHSKSEGYVPTCKVCLCSDETQDDVLISPCKCKGYCGLIHIQCLKQWINSKVKKQYQGMVASYNFNRFECQICKTPFPQIIKKNEKRIQMMGIQKPDKPYIIIESINPPRAFTSNLHQRQQQRCLHVISGGEKNSLKIGRGHACEIRISDISVSRAHAQIELSDNKFLIKDTKSKFGTLVLFDQEYALNQKHSVMIQSGRCLYEFSIEKQAMQEQEGATESQNQELQVQNSKNQGNQQQQ